MSLPQTFSHWPTWPLPVVTPVMVTAPHECGYLPDRYATFRAFDADRLSGEQFQRLQDAGFRRSGAVIYQPMCAGCRSCVPLRVPVADFTPDKGQRRSQHRNPDIEVRIAAPHPTLEKWELYARYQRDWHGTREAPDIAGFISFLYRSPVETVEFEYRDAGERLLGVGICDVTPRSISSVYFYFDPREKRRSLGTFSALYEISWARELKLKYWYAGYWIATCRRMAYKSQFKPCEILGTDGTWRPFESLSPPPPRSGATPTHRLEDQVKTKARRHEERITR